MVTELVMKTRGSPEIEHIPLGKENLLLKHMTKLSAEPEGNFYSCLSSGFHLILAKPLLSSCDALQLLLRVLQASRNVLKAD